MKNYFLNESTFVHNISDNLCLEDNLRILSIYKDILADTNFCEKFKIHDIVPGYNSVAFYFNYNDAYLFEKEIVDRIQKVDNAKSFDPKVHYIDVEYNGIDLEEAAQRLNLEIPEIIKRHTNATYHIAMLGFKPYLPYLLGLDQSLSLPRLDTPRNRVTAGSIGIGGAQTAVFPVQTPTGWHIIGNTDFKDFDEFSPGDKIIFRSV